MRQSHIGQFWTGSCKDQSQRWGLLVRERERADINNDGLWEYQRLDVLELLQSGQDLSHWPAQSLLLHRADSNHHLLQSNTSQYTPWLHILPGGFFMDFRKDFFKKFF